MENTAYLQSPQNRGSREAFLVSFFLLLSWLECSSLIMALFSLFFFTFFSFFAHNRSHSKEMHKGICVIPEYHIHDFWRTWIAAFWHFRFGYMQYD